MLSHSQSRLTYRIQQTNENMKQIHYTSVKRGRTGAIKSRLMVEGEGCFASHWLDKYREVSKPLTFVVKQNQ